MPIFEYICKSCDSEFEVLIQGDQEPACPDCEGDELEKKLSVFAVNGADLALREPMGPCATCDDPCGARACALD